MSEKIEQIRRIAKSYFGNVDSSHDWLHIKRVENLAEKIAKKENADTEIVKLAVLLHDIGRKKEDRGKIEDHSSWGAKKAREILQEQEYQEEIIEKVAHCIDAHRYSTEPEPQTLEAKIVADADNLDALGATGVARTFSVGGERGSPLADPDTPVEEDETEAGKTSLNHFYKKILKLKQRMYTETGRKIAKKRHEFTEDFVERLEKEIRGEK